MRSLLCAATFLRTYENSTARMPGGTASARFSKLRAAGASLRSAYRREEFVDFGAKMMALGRQRLCRGENLCGGRAGLGGAAIDVGDAGRDLTGALGRLADIAGDLLRCGALLLDRRGDRR